MRTLAPTTVTAGYGALGDLAAAAGARLSVDPCSRVPDGAGPDLVVLTGPAGGATVDALADLLGRGTAVVVAVAPSAAASVAAALADHGFVLGTDPCRAVDPTDPLVDTLRVDAEADGLQVTVEDAVAVAGADEPVLRVGGTVIGARRGPLTVLGTARLGHDALLTSAGNAAFVHRLLSGERSATAGGTACAHRPAITVTHRLPPVVTTRPEDWGPFLATTPPAAHPLDDAFVTAAGRAGRLLPAAVFDALVDFADAPPSAGALLLRGCPTGDLPPTPGQPRTVTGKDRVSEYTLLAVARRLGQPVGYLPEHGGDVVQDIVPTPGSVGRQVSTSSGGPLMFHTETAFHRHKPRHLLLLCLRGDPSAVTTLASIRELVSLLPLGARRVLHEPRFRTAADESFVGARPTRLGLPVPVLSGTWEAPTLTFDADLMVGIDAEAEEALGTLAELIDRHHTGVRLEPGDLLVVDNHLAVHGRSPFRARFDGTDRWLQRTFVVADLGPSAPERAGRIITTRFGR